MFLFFGRLGDVLLRKGHEVRKQNKNVLSLSQRPTAARTRRKTQVQRTGALHVAGIFLLLPLSFRFYTTHQHVRLFFRCPSSLTRLTTLPNNKLSRGN